MHPMLNIAIKAARRAGSIINRAALDRTKLEVRVKQANDFVTQVDKAAESAIIDIIRQAYPDHAILAEEGGATGKHDVTWIIDPLDGTTNFLHRFPHFAVSIGIQIKGKLEHGVIYAPCTQDLYVAGRGRGAVLNSRKIRVSKISTLEDSLVGTGVPSRAGANLDLYMSQLRTIVEKTSGVRRAGAASLDLAYVACGRLDAFWENNLKPWDLAAGILMVEEAGGIVSELYGKGEVLETGNVLAGNPKLHDLAAPLLRN